MTGISGAWNDLEPNKVFREILESAKDNIGFMPEPRWSPYPGWTIDQEVLDLAKERGLVAQDMGMAFDMPYDLYYNLRKEIIDNRLQEDK